MHSSNVTWIDAAATLATLSAIVCLYAVYVG